jgi:hypothetical protein
LPGSPYCKEHQSLQPIPVRPSAHARGYDATWQRIRIIVLSRAGIPREDWHLWDVDHDPPYNPEIEPDHLKYRLTPHPHGDHSSKTARDDGGFGNEKHA